MINVHMQLDLQQFRPKDCNLQVVRISVLDEDIFCFELPFEFMPSQNVFVNEEFELPGYLVSESLILRIQCAFICDETSEIGNYCRFLGRFSRLESTEQIQMSNGAITTLLFARRPGLEAKLRVLRIVPLAHNFEMKVAFQGQFVNYMDYLGLEVETPETKIIYKWGEHNILIEDCQEIIIKLVFAPFSRKLYEAVSFYNLMLQIDTDAVTILKLELNVPHRQNYFIQEMSHLISLYEENDPFPDVENNVAVYFFNKYVQQQMNKIKYSEAIDSDLNYPRFSTGRIEEQVLSKPIAALLGARENHVQSPQLPKGVVMIFVQNGAKFPTRRIFKSLSQREELFAEINVIQIMPIVEKATCDIIIATNNKERISEFFSYHNLQIIDVERDESKLEDLSVLGYQPLQEQYKIVRVKRKAVEFDICVPTSTGGIDSLKSTILPFFVRNDQERITPDHEMVLLVIKIVKDRLMVIDEARLSYGSRDGILIDALFKTVQNQLKTRSEENLDLEIKWKNAKLRDFHQQLRRWQANSSKTTTED